LLGAKVKVLIYGTLAGKGGVQRIVYWLAKCLSDTNFQVLVLSPGSAKRGTVNQISDILPFQVIFSEQLAEKMRFSSSNKIKLLKALIDTCQDFNPDIYIGVGNGWNLSILPLFLENNARKIFYEVVTGIPNGWRDSRWGVKLWFDGVVGISPIITQCFIQGFHWKKSSAAIPGFAEPLEITANLPIAQQRIVPPGKVRAAYFGRLVAHKRPLWLVQQWENLKDCLDELHIHGVGPEETAIEEYIASQGIGDRVKFFGSYPSEGQAYADLLSSYDLMLLPTLGNEGAPLVLMEAMACGVTFVANGVCGIPDYAIDNANVLVVPPSSAQFIQGVRQMTARLAAGEIDQAALQQYYLDRYSYAALKQAWLSYLDPTSA
jgi:glycosyltransferase involved in cell wall biosynthesis